MSPIYIFILLWGIASSSLMRDLNYEIGILKQELLSIQFDSSFYSVLLIENKTSHQNLRILDLSDMTTSTHMINVTGPLMFCGLLNTGSIVIVSKSNAYLASKLDGYSAIEMPEISSFLKNNQISNQSHFNDFNQTILAVYNVNKMLELDVRMPLQAKANEFRFGSSEAFSGLSILDMTYVNFGRNFAILSEKSDVEAISIYNQKSRAYLQKLGDQVDDTKRIAYNVELNLVILVKFSSKNILIFDSSEYKEVGSINFSLTGLDVTKISNLYSPLGTKVLLIISGYKVYIFDLVTKSFISEFLLPADSLEGYWAEGTQYFLSKHNQGADKYSYKLFKLESSDTRFCHKSCGLSCKEVFKPCYNTWSIVFSMSLGILSVAVLGLLVYYAMIHFIKKDDAKDISDDQGNVYELTEEGFRPKRNTISLEPGELQIDIDN